MTSSADIIFKQIPQDPDGVLSRYRSWNEQLEARKPRFPNNIGAYDQRSTSYNMNCYAHGTRDHFVGEGPCWRDISFDLDQMQRYFQAIISNAIDHIIVAGSVAERRSSGFLAYFLPEIEKKALLSASGYDDEKMMTKLATEEFGGIVIASELTGHQYPNLKNYTMTIHYKNVGKITIPVTHISIMNDFATCVFNDNEVRQLASINERSKKLMIHCGAGLGRSGVIELAFSLYDEVTFLWDRPDIKLVQAILKKLREKRPGLVQTAEQFQMAIELAAQMKSVNYRKDKVIERKQITDTVNQALEACVEEGKKE